MTGPLSISTTDKDSADFLSDIEIASKWGVCDKTARRAIKALEAAGGFPPKDPLFGGKRYWPAVDAFMKRRAGLNIAAVQTTDGEENWNETPQPRRRARPQVGSAR